MATDLSKRLHFLNDAAHLLIKSAPETSSYLMDSRRSLMANNGVRRSDAEKQQSCIGCGQIVVVGQGTSLKIETVGQVQSRKVKTRATSKSKHNKTNDPPALCKTYTCERCGAFTRITLPKPAAPLRREAGRRTRALSKPGPPAVVAKQPTANTNSKKRAKARKAGLQALVDDRPKSGLGSGLSLSSFLKKS